MADLLKNEDVLGKWNTFYSVHFKYRFLLGQDRSSELSQAASGEFYADAMGIAASLSWIKSENLLFSVSMFMNVMTHAIYHYNSQDARISQLIRVYI